MPVLERKCLARVSVSGRRKTSDFLALYCQVFNAVEGNTTFYASPSPATVQRWAEIMPAHFRFTAKFPGDISHSGDLREQLTAAETFLQLLKPLGERVSPLWLQLSKSFTPQRLPELAAFIDALDCPLAVEVRNEQFFAKGESERLLNRLLLDRGVERICLDPRALFSCLSTESSVIHAQSKNRVYRRVRRRSRSFRRCVSSAIPSLRQTMRFLCRGWRKSLNGSKRAARPTSFCIPPITCWQRNWRNVFTQN